MQITRDDIEAIADRSASRAVEGVFLRLGVDTKDPTALKELRSNLALTGSIAESVRVVRKTALTTAVGGVVTGLITLFVIGFKDWIFK